MMKMQVVWNWTFSVATASFHKAHTSPPVRTGPRQGGEGARAIVDSPPVPRPNPFNRRKNNRRALDAGAGGGMN